MARDSFDESTADKPRTTAQARAVRYPCRADGCPMAGTVDATPDRPGLCGYHYRENPNDWPAITRTLIDWECVTRAINKARRVMTSPLTCTDGKAQAQALKDAWAEMLPALTGGGWKRRLVPQELESLGDWGRRLEIFLGARLKEKGSGGAVDETKPTPFVEQARKELRGVPLGNAADGFA